MAFPSHVTNCGSLTSTEMKLWLPRIGTYNWAYPRLLAGTELLLGACTGRQTGRYTCMCPITLHAQPMQTSDKFTSWPSEITWISSKPRRINAKCFTELVHFDIAHSGFSQP